jgi:hypothetical protein
MGLYALALGHLTLIGRYNRRIRKQEERLINGAVCTGTGKLNPYRKV